MDLRDALGLRAGTDASTRYREQQAALLLREAGFVEQPDGTWVPADEITEPES